ncbi:MAG: 3-phosphoserine/phosphohydroxythreonine transaminase [Myxococcales bacterium]|nr:3-phosphoserine/phosphohydroxythreonine transaminase [Myxococcales bacterium]
MSEQRHVNFNPGPSTLPLPALERAQKEFLNYEGSGMSILEHSHRGPVYTAVHEQTIALLTELLSIPPTHQILFMQGGASSQFALLPMNLRTDSHAGDYIVTGTWAKKALAEAKVVGTPHVAWDGAADGTWTRVPKQDELDLSQNAPYVHITSNNTIMGTQFFDFPDTANVPLVADMSSDILWRPLDISKFGIIYAGAQKNMGPSGITVVIIRKDLLEQTRTDLPKIFRYREIAAANSLQNTIPTFPVYLVRNVLMWLKDEGGPAEMERRNRKKAALIYTAVDESGGFYRCPVEARSRSVMNPVFRLATPEMEKDFIAKAADAGMVGLKGHRSVGGIRASIYNAMPVAGVEQLASFMADYQKRA